MLMLKSWNRRLQSFGRAIRWLRPKFMQSSRVDLASSLRNAPLPFPVIASCPAPNCPCSETPAGLVIDHRKPLNGTMVAHAHHVLILTGRDDWKSRIEEEDDGGGLVRELKTRLGPKGKFSNPFNNILMTNSSFSPSHRPGSGLSSAILLPSFQKIPSIPINEKSLDDFVKGFLLPVKLHPTFDSLPTEQQRNLLHDETKQVLFDGVMPINEILILICGHGGRDERCGIMGPLLRREFFSKLDAAGISASQEPRSHDTEGTEPFKAVVGLISHIGGHKFAGNVIIYLPPSLPQHPLAGKGIWYGRVEPKHVEGIIESTVKKGIVIEELFRGGIGSNGEILRL